MKQCTIICFLILLVLSFVGCNNEEYIDEHCSINEYVCRGAQKTELFVCRLLEKSSINKKLTRFEKVSEWEKNNICSNDCETCAKELNEAPPCVAGRYQCIEDRLQECQIVDEINKITRWVDNDNDLCNGAECESCAKDLNLGCKEGKFRCDNNDMLQECQIIDVDNNLTRWMNSDLCNDEDCESCASELNNGCKLGQFKCNKNELLVCEDLDNDRNLSRWQKAELSCHDFDCETCAKELNSGCEIGNLRCMDDKQLQECKVVDYINNLTLWMSSDICNGVDCNQCLSEIKDNCTAGDFRCSEGHLEVCQIIDFEHNYTRWRESDICDDNCESCLNIFKSGCATGQLLCKEQSIFECKTSSSEGVVNTVKKSNQCLEPCAKGCSDDDCIKCLNEHNIPAQECGSNSYFDYQTATCLDMDGNHNHMHDQYEVVKNTPCRIHSDCDSSYRSGDGFCDSFINYQCSTRCVSDDQCLNGYICRPDGRCAPDTFETIWNVPNKMNDMSITIYARDCDIEEIDWGDGTKDIKISICNDENKPITHTYNRNGKFNVKIKGKIKLWSAHPLSETFDTQEKPEIYSLMEVVSFGPVGLGPHCFAGTEIDKLSKVDIPDASLIEDLSYAFSYTDFNGEILYWDMSNVKNIKGMFFKSSFNQDVYKWDTSKITNMSSLFYFNPNFNRSLNGWDTSKVETMRRMFGFATNFNSDISKLDTTNVVTMSEMFIHASSFNQAVNTQTIMGHKYWDTSNVTDMSYMFADASVFDKSISGWNTSKVTNMEAMFQRAKAFNQNINTDTDNNTWNTSNVTLMRYMFEEAESFNQPLSNWKTDKVTNMYRMFKKAGKFNQNITSWNTNNVKFMHEMFYGATIFNQNLSKWKTPKVVALQHIFDNSSFSYDISGWDVSKIPCDTTGSFYHMFSNSKLEKTVCNGIAKQWLSKNPYWKSVNNLEKFIGNLGCPK